MEGKLSEERGPKEGRQKRAQGVLGFLCSQNVALWACFWAKGLQGQNSPGRSPSLAGAWAPGSWHS